MVGGLELLLVPRSEILSDFGVDEVGDLHIGGVLSQHPEELILLAEVDFLLSRFLRELLFCTSEIPLDIVHKK